MSASFASASAPAPAAQLRALTAEVHERVESLALFQKLRSATLDRDEFAQIQARFFGVLAPLEASISIAARSSGAELRTPNRAPVLARDLIALGINPDELDRAAVARAATAPQSLGRIYVLEGSRLGGRVIRRWLEAHEWFDIDRHGQFFVEAPNDLPWPRIQGELNRALCQPADLASACAAAVRTFEIIEDWMQRDG